MPTARLHRETAVLAIIDVQERLMPVIDAREQVEANIDRLVRGCHILGVPALITEQYVKGLGTTVPLVRRALEESGGYAPIEKSCFSSFGCGAFVERLEASARHQVILCGVEAHVCVYQTAIDLLDAGYEVVVAADAVSSRSPHNKEIAIRRLTSEGAKLGSTEMVLFEMLVASGGDEFRAIARLVK